MICRKEMPIAEMFHVRAETPPNCTGVAETPTVYMVVADMPSVCTGVVYTPPDHNRLGGTLPLSQNKRSGLMTTPEKIALRL